VPPARKAPPKGEAVVAERPAFSSREECLVAGKALRGAVPREAHAAWKPPSKRHRDPVEILVESSRGRVPELVPIRYGRMLRSPFTFLRGSAGLMAHDLATTPSTGLQVQACGDCHLANFGLFATPERNLVFDINDFDETLPAPWEWDLKRLAASFAVASLDNRHTKANARSAVVACVRAYRERLRSYSKMSPLDVWYDRLDIQTLIEAAPDAETKSMRERYAAKARERVADYLFPKITGEVGGRRRLRDQLPTLFHVDDRDAMDRARLAVEEYRRSLPDSVRVMFDRYRLEDIAVKVVGIGSVGTRCYVALFFSTENHPLLLQFKEARTSVLAPFAGKSRYENQGQRIVVGQRLTQSSSDIFLGWTRSIRGYDFFARQLRDMKFSFPIEVATPVQMKRYAGYCGWTLARSHAKSGDSATISGYLGKTGSFDQAIAEFAVAYAKQTESDHAALVAAVKAGRIEAVIEENL
jgi:uncharacterized protein (DUF2252 family)